MLPMLLLQHDTIVLKPMKNSYGGKSSPWASNSSTSVNVVGNKERIANVLIEQTDEYTNKAEV